MDNRSGSKSILFLMEQLIAILVFAICAAVCVRIFFFSYETAGESSDTNNALIAARNGAECYKAAGGETGETAALLNGVHNGASVISVYYDGNWQVCAAEDAAYIMTISDAGEGSQLLNTGNLSVGKTNGDEIIAFTVAARRDAG